MPYALNDSTLMYIDRTYQYDNVPISLKGSTYIVTAEHEDKFWTGNNFLSFSVNKPVTVYVARSILYKSKPSWLSDYIPTGLRISGFGHDTGNFMLELFKHDFNVGTITLGGNMTPGETGNYAMYTVIIVEK